MRKTMTDKQRAVIAFELQEGVWGKSVDFTRVANAMDAMGAMPEQAEAVALLYDIPLAELKRVYRGVPSTVWRMHYGSECPRDGNHLEIPDKAVDWRFAVLVRVAYERAGRPSYEDTFCPVCFAPPLSIYQTKERS